MGIESLGKMAFWAKVLASLGILLKMIAFQAWSRFKKKKTLHVSLTARDSGFLLSAFSVQVILLHFPTTIFSHEVT